MEEEGSERAILNKTTYKITFTGMMFALVLIFQFLEKFMPFGEFGFVKFNFTLAFVLVTAAHIDYIWAIGLLLLRFIFGPLLSGEGYAPMSVIGQIILLIVGLIVLGLFFVTKSKDKKFTKKQTVIRLMLIVIGTSMIVPWLNATIFTPWYLGAFNSGGGWSSVGIDGAINSYKYLKEVYYFGIPNYWAGQFVVYFVFNTINLTLTMLITFPLLKISKILGNKN